MILNTSYVVILLISDKANFKWGDTFVEKKLHAFYIVSYQIVYRDEMVPLYYILHIKNQKKKNTKNYWNSR